MKTNQLTANFTKTIFAFASVMLLQAGIQAYGQTAVVGPNQYAFQLSSNNNYGLFFNGTTQRYDFRNGSGNPIFSFDANNGRMATNLEFLSGADYLVANNSYAFRAASNPNFGLFFNATGLQYELRNASAQSVFAVNATNGNFKNDLQFDSGRSLRVPAGNWAVRSATAPNTGIFFGASDIEVRNTAGNPAVAINATTGVTTFANTVNAPGGNSDQWNQAHAWGNHASAGYMSGATLDNNTIPRWNGSALVNGPISASANAATITGSVGNILVGEGNLLTLNNTNLSGPNATRINFQQNGSSVGLLRATGAAMRMQSINGDVELMAGENSTLAVGSASTTYSGSGQSVGVNVENAGGSGAVSFRLRRAGTQVGAFQMLLFSNDLQIANNTSNGALHLRTNGADRISVDSDGRVGIGAAPISSAQLRVRSEENTTVMSVTSGHQGNSNLTGIAVTALPAQGYGVGINAVGGRTGVQGTTSGTSSFTTYGVNGSASGSGGERIGVYGQATGGTTNWAGYFGSGNVFVQSDLRIGSTTAGAGYKLAVTGNAYVSNNLRIGTTTGATGYALSVNGKAICTEMRVQLQSQWPDYVFGESHQRLSLDALESFIQEEKHLPGLPSAAQVEAQGGIDLGEMQRLTVEKVEELTLYILELKKISDELRSENAALRERLDAIAK